MVKFKLPVINEIYVKTKLDFEWNKIFVNKNIKQPHPAITSYKMSPHTPTYLSRKGSILNEIEFQTEFLGYSVISYIQTNILFFAVIITF